MDESNTARDYGDASNSAFDDDPSRSVSAIDEPSKSDITESVLPSPSANGPG